MKRAARCIRSISIFRSRKMACARDAILGGAGGVQHDPLSRLLDAIESLIGAEIYSIR